MKKLTLLLGLALVGMPTAVLAQGQEAEEMADEAAHEAHEMAAEDGMAAMHAKMSEQARAAIDEVTPQFESAFASGDAAAIAALYTEDAIAYPPGSEAVEGRAAIQEMWGGVLTGMGGGEVDLETEEVYGVHGSALEIGKYTITGADGSHVDHGNFMVAWKETDDGWKLARDMWNSNMSADQ